MIQTSKHGSGGLPYVIRELVEVCRAGGTQEAAKFHVKNREPTQ